MARVMLLALGMLLVALLAGAEGQRYPDRNPRVRRGSWSLYKWTSVGEDSTTPYYEFLYKYSTASHALLRSIHRQPAKNSAVRYTFPSNSRRTGLMFIHPEELNNTICLVTNSRVSSMESLIDQARRRDSSRRPLNNRNRRTYLRARAEVCGNSLYTRMCTGLVPFETEILSTAPRLQSGEVMRTVSTFNGPVTVIYPENPRRTCSRRRQQWGRDSDRRRGWGFAAPLPDIESPFVASLADQ